MLKEHEMLLAKVGFALAAGSTLLAIHYGGLAIAQAVACDVLFPAGVLMCWSMTRKANPANLVDQPSLVRNKLRQLRSVRK